LSNRSRGAAFETRIKQYLESVGYTVDKARAALAFRGPGKFFSSQNDFLGCADLLAVHPQRPWTLFVQATLGQKAPRQKKMEAVDWNLNAQKVQLWTRPAPGHARILTLHRNTDDAKPFWTERSFRLCNGIVDGGI
jgi:hypothetical protein